ncbi:hypothetical protein EZV62_025506 [Acer yangbiense]|uniref:AAA+ ATPase domain-containing protein n=1 Tax=Acer yangbiense TaxID=1000413 RepID=A0A5C7GYH3_9ROSI|nr:hypothetical protein EZV62_025506 [Acer yangbiense]
MEELNDQVDELINVRKRMQRSVDEATRQGEEIEEDVQTWMKSVDDFIEDIANPILEYQGKAEKPRLFTGFCVNLMTRYLLSKKAAKTVKHGVKLLPEVKSVSYRRFLGRINSIYFRGYEDFPSRKSLFKNIIKALTNADTYLIGVHGMGGVGKTTLVEKVAWQAKEDKLFDVVVMAEVTEKPDIKNIQAQIADELGLKFHEESLSGRAARLRDRLRKENRVLVVLDNIWTKLDFEKIGIPFGDYEKPSAQQNEDDEKMPLEDDVRRSVQLKEDTKERNGDQKQCKILMTARSEDVLRNHMDQKHIFSVKVLSDEEACNLFEKIVGEELAKNFKRIATEIVKKCDGLPVAIATIANALKNKSDLSVWRNALDQLTRSNARNVKGMEANVYSAIELSYNFLENEEAKSLFLLCGLCKASNYNIHVNDLLRYGMGLGLFEDVYTLEAGRNRVHTLIKDLKASCLILDYDDSTLIKMHDIVHVVAVSIASTTKLMFNIQNVIGLEEVLEEKLPTDTTAVSMLYKDIPELPERLECPKLKILLLLMKDLYLQIPDAFFEEMKELKVLDLTRIHLLSVPSSLLMLTNLQTLCLKSCLLEDIAIIGELKKLKILNFSNSDIEALPGEIGQLTRLKLLDLSNCSKLKVIPSNVLSRLTRLEELYIGNSFVQWEVEGRNNASLAELKQLSRLTTLDMHVLDAQIVPQDLFLEKLERYRIFIGDVWNWFDKFETSRMLKLKLNNRINLGYGPIEILLNKAEDLYLDELEGVNNVHYELHRKDFQQLKHLHVQYGTQIQYIIKSVGLEPCNAFPILESLFLRNLINLEKICHGQLAAESFSKLRIIKVGQCDRLRRLFSFSIANNLLQLQEIEVTDCENLEEIVFRESKELVHKNESIGWIEFTQLRTLRLQCLPQLKSFYLNMLSAFSQNVLLPRLENLKLSSINIECMWFDQFPAMSSCCQTLTSLSVEKCSGNLKFLFSYSVVKSLVQLKKLEIRNCKSIEGIINTEELGGEEMVMVFPKLLSLQLQGLPKLTRFGSGQSLKFRTLTELSIKDCPNLKTFFPASAEEMNCQADMHLLFGKKVELPILAFLELFSISIQTIWHNQLHAMSRCFQSLTNIVMDGCHNLKYVFSSSTVTSFVQLKILKISDCKFLERVIVIEENRSNNLFPKLQGLYRIHLPELTSFCNFTGNSIELPFLDRLRIENCPKMCTFISNAPHTDMAASEEPEEMNSEENLLSDIQPLFDRKVGLPSLKFLQIEQMNNLTTVWHNQLSSDSCKLKFVGLQKCSKLLNVFPSNMLERLQELEELWIVDCDSLGEIFELQALNCGKTQAITATQLRKLVLCNLPSLKHVWNMDSKGLLSFKNLLSILIRGCNSLKSIFPASIAIGLLQLKELEIGNCPMVEEIIAMEEEQVEAVPRFVFPQLLSLELGELSRLKSFYPGFYISEWPVLKKLEVWGCDKVELLASEFSSLQEIHGENPNENSIQPPLFLVHKAAFPNLEELAYFILLNIAPCLVATPIELSFIFQAAFPNLEELALDWNCIVKELLNGKFLEYLCKLKALELIDASKETAICPCCFLYTLPNLEKLDVTYGFLEEIFVCEGLGCKEKHIEATSKLRQLKLFDLKDSLHLWEENSFPCKVFQNLTTLEVLECSNLQHLVPSFVSFQNLTTLEVSKCNKLLNLMAVSTAKSLVQLSKIKISECKMIEGIVTHMEDEVENPIIFSQLKYLGLHCLPSLTSFYPGNNMIEFPSLQQVIVRQCPSMEIFSQGVMSTPKLHRLQTTEANHKGYWEGSLNMTIQKMFKDMVCIHSTHFASSLHYHGYYWFTLCVFFPKKTSCLVCTTTTLPSGEVGFCGIEHLTLSEFPHLKEVWHDQSPASFFSNLKSLVMDECTDILKAISDNLLRCLNSLETLDVRNCDLLQEVFDLEELNADRHLEVLSKLSEFSLVDLPRLQHIWKKNHPQVLGFRNLKLMKVDNCRSLKYIFSPSVAFGFVQLQELEIKNCAIVEAIIVIEEERISNTLFPNLNRVVLDDLPKLTSVCNLAGNSIKLPSLAELLIQNCLNMQMFNSNTTGADVAASNVQPNVQPFFDDKVGLPCLKFLRIKQMDNLTKIWDNQLTMDSSLALENLSLIGCNKLLNVFPSSMLGRLQKLKELLVSECDSLEVIFEELTKKDVEGVPRFVFPQLTYLELVHLPRLKRFYPGLYISKWPMLKKLRVWRCDEEMILTSDPSLQEIRAGENQSMFLVYKAAFPNLEELSLDWNCIVKEMLKRNFSKYSRKLKVLELIDVSKETAICPYCFLYTLPNLEKLEVTCGLLKEMFVCGCKEKHVEAPSKLRQLTLFNLKDSLHKWEENPLPCKVFQNLATLELSECGNLQQLVPSFVSFQNLTTLEVTKCNGLLNLMTVSTAKSLVQLSKMNISECKMLEGIITHVGDDVETPIIFSQLKYLVLHCLPSLTSFYSGNHTIEFPSLQQAIVRQCPSMKIFSHSVLSTPRLHRLKITEEVDHKGSWEGSLNMTIKKLFQGMVGFCGIEYLTLSEFPHLKEVWDDQFPARFFSNLKSLVMDECTNILKAISGNLLQCLNSLETLDVRSCDLLQEVFDLEELSADGHLEVLSKLSEFSLVDLPRLQHIWKKNHPQVLGFRNLKLMRVDKCSSLKYVFTTSVAMVLEQLKQLKIKNCVMVEAIIVIKEEGIGNTLFPNLKRLGIKDLPKLTGFCNLAGNSIKLPSLAELQIQNCPNMQTFNSNFTSAGISASNENLLTNIQPFFDEKVGLPKLKFLRIDKMDKLRKIWHDDQLMSTSFCELEYFKVVNCNKLLNVFPYNMFGRLGRLEKLWISKCDSLEEIFDLQAFSSGKSQAIAATQLRELVLHYLPNLKHVWNMESQCLLSFQNLLYLEVEGLDSLKSVFPASIAKCPLQLEELRINKCCMVEEIVSKEEVNEVLPTFEFPKLTLLELCKLSRLKIFYPELYISKWPVLKKLLLCKCDEVTVLASEFQENNNGESQNETPIRQPMFLTDQVAFPNLKKLYLFELSQLLHLWKENSQNSSVFEKLTSLDVSDCDNLKTLVPSWMSLQSLTTLEVWRCNGLMNLMTLSTAKTLVQLAKMDIFECKMLEEIIGDDQGDEGKDGIVLNQLKILKLDSLPSLTSFCIGNFTIEFPSLEQVRVIECLNMKTFSGGILRTPKLQRLQLTEKEDGTCQEVDLNITIQERVYCCY